MARPENPFASLGISDEQNDRFWLRYSELIDEAMQDVLADIDRDAHPLNQGSDDAEAPPSD